VLRNWTLRSGRFSLHQKLRVILSIGALAISTTYMPTHYFTLVCAVSLFALVVIGKTSAAS
jgi:4-hydroxybenzoate polyprenyltransferase